MTTVALRRDKKSGLVTMAADTYVSGGWPDKKYKKIVKIGNAMVGICGTVNNAERFFEWCKRGMPEDDMPRCTGEFEAITYTKEGGIFLWVDSGTPVKIKTDFVATGSGAPYAIGALCMGATAEQAIKIAAEYDEYTKLPLIKLKMNFKE
jgi:ATP-dependent protease HslVU (ClpYQ) peptidase subunit